MPYIVECPSGVDSLTESQVVCLPDVGNSVDVLPPIGEAEIAVLLSGALGVFALAWGFRMIGELLFKRS